jgi:hypothetical protein
MLKFDTQTNTYYLECDSCHYPFAVDLPARIAEDGVIEDDLCFEIDGKLMCLDCLRESFGGSARMFLDQAKKRRKKEIENERHRQIRECIKIH